MQPDDLDELDAEWERWDKRRVKPLQVALREFGQQRDYRSFRAAVDSRWREDHLSPSLERRFVKAIWYAAESSDWRLRAAGISELGNISGSLARKADIIVAGLRARQESVRISSWGAASGVRLARLVLRRLEAIPSEKLLIFEVLMAVDWMADYLTEPSDRERLIAFVRRLERQPQRSGVVAWKIGESLYSHLHFGLEPDDDSIDADHWREYRQVTSDGEGEKEA